MEWGNAIPVQLTWMLRDCVSFPRVDPCASVHCLVDQAGYREFGESSSKVLHCAEADLLENGT